MLEQDIKQLSNDINENTKVNLALTAVIQTLIENMATGLTQAAEHVVKKETTKVPAKKQAIQERTESRAEITQIKQEDEPVEGIEVADLVAIMSDMDASLRSDMKKLLVKYGAKKLPDLKVEDYPAFYLDATTLVSSLDKAA